MSTDKFQRLVIRALWAILFAQARTAAGMVAPVKCSDIELDLRREVEDQDLKEQEAARRKRR